ncbi:ABC transporter ATP-binding protein [Eubacterium sp.]|uniref:ABC transporter ATP-binding protein n=1 Tax=Eubacterium sp. TaxID=142586 RepID=UPI002588662A|nr:ABC transporter ATP-binding protein [Eubacterium sp.]MCR5368123.1 ABC transporter ATP-binding protein [Eubacterium sp.]
MSTLLKVKNIKKDNILNSVSFEMMSGEMIAIMGPSGSGKSTLLYNVSGMDQADGGEVWLGDTEIVHLSEDDKAKLRLNRMGFVFQQMNMISNLNIIDNIVFPAVRADKKHRAEHYDRARKLLDDFHIGDIAEKRIREVSGGQLQRACICRSMIINPEIIFADEPTGALNRTSAAEVMEAFLRINRKGATIMMVTHDSWIASKCERIIYLLDGEIKGELRLGKSMPEDGKERELKLVRWLEEFGW